MADEQASLLTVERPEEGCVLLTLQRPQAFNALSFALRRQLARTLQELGADGRTRVVVLTGAGRAFCAGVDLRELAGAENLSEMAVGGAADDPVHAVLAFPGPVIAAVNGPAVTGGLELAIACDIVIASERATFADTHARVGVLPSWGLSQRLPRLIGRGRALEMSLSGNFVDARQAQAWGLVNRTVGHDELLPAALRLASDMLSTAPGMLAQYKRLIDDGLATTLQEGLVIEARRAREWAASVDRSALSAQAAAVKERGRGANPRGEG
ncbi:enoyl-CoA hydratase [Ramlibacter henchirensis]|uniref:Enoyl-CoA hydratase n=1 Tax=Ramlibacter henchirensis TaxID=204072 RepID=A0A4Z0BTR1_9BURK|nr:enoyl-CoA hydratase [Ramlibacter henchirensis]TFZ02707.1 enoyl-CoA hydratase [Ramlibacter henchirensis]